jgi:hypothetical protein
VSQLPLWAQWLQLIATITVAVFAGWIAFGQWQIARKKLVLDLFEKRFQVFYDVRKVHSELTQQGKLSDGGLPNEIIARGRFLFGPEVVAKLREFHTVVVQLELHPPSAEHGAARRPIRQDAESVFNELLTMFETYMGMPEKPPLPLWTSLSQRFNRARARLGF